MLIPGAVSATFRDKGAEDIIRLCAKACLRGVEWSENAHVFPGDAAGAAALGEKTRDAGLRVAAYGSYYRLGASREPQRDFGPSLISAQALGAPLIRVWAGTVPSAQASEEYVTHVAEEAAAIAEMAAGSGIRVAFEWHKNSLTDTNESAMNLLRRAGHPNLYCLWQPTVALTEAQRMEGLRLLGDRLLNLHMYYWPQGRRRPLEEGLGCWKRYLACADRSRDHYALLEFVMGNTEEQFARDAASLRRLLAQEEGE